MDAVVRGFQKRKSKKPSDSHPQKQARTEVSQPPALLCDQLGESSSSQDPSRDKGKLSSIPSSAQDNDPL